MMRSGRKERGCVGLLLWAALGLGLLLGAGGSCVSRITAVPCDDGTFCPEGTRCAPAPSGSGYFCTRRSCGNGVLEPEQEEQCDDGAGNSWEPGHCRPNCQLARCGDGVLDPGEACDDGNQSNIDACPDGTDGSCQPATCGDGFRWTVDCGDACEACDDGNTEDDDACPSGPLGRCEFVAECGDGIVETGMEACDCGKDAAHQPARCPTINSSAPGALCRPDCTLGGCGDGVVDPGEECDTGPLRSDTMPNACRTDCSLPACGDGVTDPDYGEECDDGPGNSDTTPNACRAHCSLPDCGDGVVDPLYGEMCDDASANSDVLPNACRADCSLPVCGDGVTDDATPYSETCDDGNLVNGDGCDDHCGRETCGNGVLDSGEGCDDGNQNNNDACPDGPGGTCQPARCGDHFLWNQECGGQCEACDDGNLVNGDGCTSGCQRENCGNGQIDQGEGCDDGNQDNNDACPDGTGGTCQPATCGDGFIWTGVEECDDGNHDNTDDCPDGPGGTCYPARCGDGFVWNGHEGCDDGNQDNNDACPDGPGGTCQPAVCGDGFVEPNTEQCDDGNANTHDACPSGPGEACAPAFCGDGYTWNVFPGQEDCDDGGIDTAGCDYDCTSVVCGDGYQNTAAGEGCDDGDHNLNDRCPDGPGGTCQDAFCGDGLVWNTDGGHEACDGGGVDTPSCDSDCTVAECGDGYLNAAAGEGCDDGDGHNDDACPDGPGGTCQPAHCGDGIVWDHDGGHEACDSGGVDTVSCDSDCTTPVCGDSHTNVPFGEDCDDGGVDTASCDADCTSVECGDGHRNTAAGEQCDDGDHNLNDRCPDGPGGTCQDAFCGDGLVWNTDGGHEACDSGGVDTSSCDSDCTVVECGDGHLNAAAGEGCDDGDGKNNDACPDGPGGTCQPATCGDGLVWDHDGGHEECDSGGVDTASCDSDCTTPLCGDNHTNVPFGEDCDTGGVDTVSCDDDCTAVECGDGHRNTAAGEQCDDGDHNLNDRCPDGPGGTCHDAFCGDGLVWNTDGGHEECDSGGVDTSSCDDDCTAVECGDGHVNAVAGEGCDDGNHDNTDACPDGAGGTCQNAYCGDSFVWSGHEECDGGGVDTPTCDSDCTTPLCGDHHTNVPFGEECDEGGVDATSCDSDCTLVVCGDGHPNAIAGELCDDGNHDNTDACPDGAGGTCQPAICGDGFVWSGHEECDGSDLNGETCVTLGYTGGTLACTGGCTYDTSGCT